MEAVCTSETLVYFNETTQRYVPESCHLHNGCHDRVKICSSETFDKSSAHTALQARRPTSTDHLEHLDMDMNENDIQMELKATREPGSSVSIVSGYGLDDRAIDPRQRRKDFSSSLCVQIDSAVHPASCPMGTRVLSQVMKCSQGVTLTTHPHLVPRSRMSKNYISSPSKLLRDM
jgi:hypothetical protein